MTEKAVSLSRLSVKMVKYVIWSSCSSCLEQENAGSCFQSGNVRLRNSSHALSSIAEKRGNAVVNNFSSGSWKSA